MVRCGMVWYGMVLYGMVWYGIRNSWLWLQESRPVNDEDIAIEYIRHTADVL